MWNDGRGHEEKESKMQTIWLNKREPEAPEKHAKTWGGENFKSRSHSTFRVPRVLMFNKRRHRWPLCMARLLFFNLNNFNMVAITSREKSLFHIALNGQPFLLIRSRKKSSSEQQQNGKIDRNVDSLALRRGIS